MATLRQLVVSRRERPDPQIYGAINRPDRIGIYSGAVAVDRRQAPEWIPILGDAPDVRWGSRSPDIVQREVPPKNPRGQSGRKRARQAGFAYAPARLFRAHSARAARRAIPFNPLKPFDHYGFSDLVAQRRRPVADDRRGPQLLTAAKRARARSRIAS